MPSKSLNGQQGAVLIFILVMLVLLTLVNVSMIQQNKTQLTITSNVGEQVKTFSRAEMALNVAESMIEAQRKPYKDDPTKLSQKDDCGINGQLYENGKLDLPETIQATATIKAVFCAINSFEYRCVGENSYTAHHAESTENTNACAKLTNAQCPSEVYTIDVTLTDSHTEAQRTIRSKFSVGCSVFT